MFTLQTLPACDPEEQFGDTVGKVAGFSLHAGVAARADERKKLERLCRYVARPAVSEKRVSLTPNGKYHALVTKSARGKGNKAKESDEPQTPAGRRAAMTWAQRLKRVFNIDIETCRECGGAVKVIDCIEDPVVIKKILDHLKNKAETIKSKPLPKSRVPPAGLQSRLFA